MYMRISHFNNDQLKIIRTIWSIDCEKVQFLKNNEKCPIHDIRHNKLPDFKTWEELKNLYPNATLEAWGEAFYTSKESVRLLNNSLIEDKNYSSQNWNVEKNYALYGAKPYNDLFKDFFYLFVEYPNKGKENILNFLGIQNNYFEYWIKNDDGLYQDFLNAERKRKKRKIEPRHLKCYRCKQTKPIFEFGNDKSTLSGKSNTCKVCNKEGGGNKLKFEKRESEKRCDRCQNLKHISKFIHKSDSGEIIKNDICSTCYQSKKLTLSKEKMLNAGIKNENQFCVLCKNLLPIEEFYLRRKISNINEKEIWLSKECRTCIKKELEKYPTFKESIKSKWDRESKRMGEENYLYFTDFLDSYLSNIKSDLNF